MSDVPLGVFLSGGIDSASLVAIASRFVEKPLKTLSIVLDDPALDESAYARLAAETYRTDHREVEVRATTFWTPFPTSFEAMDQPTVDGVNSYLDLPRRPEGRTHRRSHRPRRRRGLSRIPALPANPVARRDGFPGFRGRFSDPSAGTVRRSSTCENPTPSNVYLDVPRALRPSGDRSASPGRAPTRLVDWKRRSSRRRCRARVLALPRKPAPPRYRRDVHGPLHRGAGAVSRPSPRRVLCGAFPTQTKLRRGVNKPLLLARARNTPSARDLGPAQARLHPSVPPMDEGAPGTISPSARSPRASFEQEAVLALWRELHRGPSALVAALGARGLFGVARSRPWSSSREGADRADGRARMSLKSLAKTGLLSAVSKLTGRHAVLLPPEAADEESMLSVDAPYRVEGSLLRVSLRRPKPEACASRSSDTRDTSRERRCGSRAARLRSSRRTSRSICERGDPARGARLSGASRCRFRPAGSAFASSSIRPRRRKRAPDRPLPRLERKRLLLRGRQLRRLRGRGRGRRAAVLELFEKHGARGPVLEVGCATGVVLEGLAGRGVRVLRSRPFAPWAVAKARERLGPEPRLPCRTPREESSRASFCDEGAVSDAAAVDGSGALPRAVFAVLARLTELTGRGLDAPHQYDELEKPHPCLSSTASGRATSTPPITASMR